MTMTTEAVRERPVLFSGPMVRAILEGRKTMTRRVVLPQPVLADTLTQIRDMQPGFVDRNGRAFRCPYGRPGDRLAVKEAAWMWCERRPNGTTPTGRPKWLYVPLRSAPVHYAADLPAGARPAGRVVSPDTGNEWGWRLKVARFLPRWASRITLEITEVRVERLGMITEDDARAEGVLPIPHNAGGYRHDAGSPYRAEFATLWDSLNAERGYSFDSSPWVWVIAFRRLDAPHAR